MKAQPLLVYLPDRRDVVVSDRYTKGNNKIGEEVFTYSRFAGQQNIQEPIPDKPVNLGTCPGSTVECEAICYAKRIKGEVLRAYMRNSLTSEVPPIPAEAKLLRIHVSGDFDTPEYILNWVKRLQARPDVTCWAYTRSWRCHSLLEFLEQLRALPNVQLFASMDPSCVDTPPVAWRRAWIWRDAPKNGWPMETRLHRWSNRNFTAPDSVTGFACPEETGHKKDCVDCRYCFDGQRNDVVFLEH
jgi:protein gp88